MKYFDQRSFLSQTDRHVGRVKPHRGEPDKPNVGFGLSPLTQPTMAKLETIDLPELEAQ